jgi:hypothetical protein
MDARGYISADEVRRALRAIYRSDTEANLQKALAEFLSDELKPVDENNRWKPSPVLILVIVLLSVLAGVFVYFSIAGHS